MEIDEFGHDPAVQNMRRVFASMETVQQKLFQAAALPPLDRRLRVWREQALQLFEQAWARAGRQGLAKTEDEIVMLYAHCLMRILERGRVSIPARVIARNEAFEQIIQDVLK